MKTGFAVVTMSDKGARGEREDTSGLNLISLLETAGYEQVFYTVIPDVKEIIVDTLKDLCDTKRVPLILTTGGTGLAPTDITPEAMSEIIEKEVPGIAELMRFESMKITPRACLSRGRAGIRKESLIINLPGSKKASEENILAVLPVLEHAIEKLLGDQSDCGRV